MGRLLDSIKASAWRGVSTLKELLRQEIAATNTPTLSKDKTAKKRKKTTKNRKKTAKKRKRTTKKRKKTTKKRKKTTKKRKN